MSDHTPERLDRIETNLETASQVLLRVSDVVESNRGDIDQLSERIGQLAQSVSELRESQSETRAALDRLIESQGDIRFTVDRLLETMVRFQEEREADRARVTNLERLAVSFVQNAEADRATMLQILEYLRNQYPGNGSGLIGE